MSNKVFFGLLILVAGILVGWFMFGNGNSLSGVLMQPTSNLSTEDERVMRDTSEEAVVTGDQEPSEKGGGDLRTVVTYTDSGFSPKTVTVEQNSIVTFMNESTRGMWVASDVHPTHQLLPGFDQLESVANGGHYEYTFKVVGTWKYHNHVNPADGGSVTVTE